MPTLVGVKFSALAQTGPEAHSAFLHNRYRVSFLGAKRPGRGVNHPPLSSAEVKESIELYLTPSLGRHGQLEAYCTFTFTILQNVVKILGTFLSIEV